MCLLKQNNNRGGYNVGDAGAGASGNNEGNQYRMVSDMLLFDQPTFLPHFSFFQLFINAHKLRKVRCTGAFFLKLTQLFKNDFI